MIRSSFQIYAVHPDGSGVHRVTYEQQDAGHPAWSPDGATIAYDCWGDLGPSVCTIRPDGSGRTQIGPLDSTAAAWSPDGTRLAWERDREIEVARRDGGDVRKLVPGEHPSWSPDGTRLAYVRDDGFDTAGLLHVAVHTVALDGSGDEFADQPFWSR